MSGGDDDAVGECAESLREYITGFCIIIYYVYSLYI